LSGIRTRPHGVSWPSCACSTAAPGWPSRQARGERHGDRCAGGSAVHPRRSRPPAWREGCAHGADPQITCRWSTGGWRIGKRSAASIRRGCRGRLLRGVRGGPWPRSFLSALWSAVPVRRLARRDMAWEGRPGAAAGAESTGLRRASRSTRATQHRRTPWLPTDDPVVPSACHIEGSIPVPTDSHGQSRWPH
jgi:hypothetical protein